MPNYRIYLKKSPEAADGEFQDWDLPWLRLVFDQRFDAQPPGEQGGRYQVLDLAKDAKGSYYVVCPVPPGKRQGAL
jgi:hypothetical protein